MSLKIVSTNIRFQNPADGQNDWPNRRDLLAQTICDYSPGVIGTQEGREPQLRDFESLLPQHQLIDRHRDWIEHRMYPSLLVNTQNFNVVESGDIWLSQTPDIPGSSSFDSAFPRVATWVKVRPYESQNLYLIANVHLDHVLDKTRIKQAEVLIEQLKKINQQNLPLVIMGDFNAAPDSQVRRHIIENAPHLYDPWQDLGIKEESSYHKFHGNFPEGARIDWFLLDRRFHCQEVYLDKSAKGELYPSDHFPLKGEIELKS